MGPKRPTPSISTTVSIPLPVKETFRIVLADLEDALARSGIVAHFRKSGTVRENNLTVGRVTVWRPEKEVRLEWHPTPWDDATITEIRIRFEDVGETRIVWEVRGWDGVLHNDGGEIAGWFASSLLPAFLLAITPSRYGDWLTDRNVRRPSGQNARRTYGDPQYHWPNFLLILDRVALDSTDKLLEVGCGGGAFLERALESGCAAVAFDHSPDMVREARERNQQAISTGRAQVLEADAGLLPVPDNEFSCAVMTGVFQFLPDPAGALREMHRALMPGGRLAVFMGTAALRGTPACPEPYASRAKFYNEDQVRALAQGTGFSRITVESPEMLRYAREAKLPDDVVEFFRGVGGALLLQAQKPS